jgi:hypothetical protein
VVGFIKKESYKKLIRFFYFIFGHYNSMEQDIRKAYVFLREKNNTIPSEVLDFMLHSSLKAWHDAENQKVFEISVMAEGSADFPIALTPSELEVVTKIKDQVNEAQKFDTYAPTMTIKEIPVKG